MEKLISKALLPIMLTTMLIGLVLFDHYHTPANEINLPNGLVSNGMETRSKFWMEIREVKHHSPTSQWIRVDGGEYNKNIPDNPLRKWRIPMAGGYRVTVVTVKNSILSFDLETNEGTGIESTSPTSTIKIVGSTTLELMAHGAIANNGDDNPQHVRLKIEPDGQVLSLWYKKS